MSNEETIIDEFTVSPPEQLSVAVIGVGNIGKPLLRKIHEKDIFNMIVGLDGNSIHLNGIEETLVEITNDKEVISDMDIIILCIPSIVSEKYDNIKNISEFILSLDLKPGALFIVETTLPLGSMEEIIEIFENKGSILGEDIFVAYAPERIDRIEWNDVGSQVRVVSANDPASLAKASSFYQLLGCDVTEVDHTRKAEAIKLYENFSRLAQIEFANEYARYCVENGLPPVEIMMKAMTKDNVQKVLPGAVGGLCLTENSLMVSKDTEVTNELFTLLTGNTGKRIERGVAYSNAFILDRKRPAILILGIGYKPKIASQEGSPAIEFSETVKGYKTLFDVYMGHSYPDSIKKKAYDVVVTFHKIPYYIKIVEKYLKSDGVIIDFTGAYFGINKDPQTYYFP